jgi:hypothetical protein
MGDAAQDQATRDLLKSSREEAQAIAAYTPRADFARLHGMPDVGQLYDHVIGEERQHLEEFTRMAAAPKPLTCREPSELRESRCESVLQSRPACTDFGGIRSWVMCEAWRKMKEGKLRSLPVSQAWGEARGTCVR